MAAFGEGALPAVLVDGAIVMHGRYPSREELAGLLEVAGESVPAPEASAGCGCGSTGC